MAATSLSDAVDECSATTSTCYMFFYEEGDESFFYACEITASIVEITNLVLQIRQGNKLYTIFKVWEI